LRTQIKDSTKYKSKADEVKRTEVAIANAMQKKGQALPPLPWQVKSSGPDEATDKGLHFSTMSPSKTTVELKVTLTKDGKVSFEPATANSGKSDKDINDAIASAKDKFETDPLWRGQLLAESTKSLTELQAAGDAAWMQNLNADTLNERGFKMVDIEAAIERAMNDRGGHAE
jgi:hypothetical protein